MAKNQLWKRISAIVLAAVIAMPAGFIASNEVKAAESIVANGDFDNEGAVDVNGWSIGESSLEDVVEMGNAVSYDFASDVASEWTVSNSSLSVADGVLNVANASKARTVDSGAFSVPEGATLGVSIKVDIASAAKVTVSLVEYTDDLSAKNITTLSYTASADGIWGEYSGTYTGTAGYTKVAFRISATRSYRTAMTIDDAYISYELATGEKVYGDGIIMDGSDYAMKLSNGNSTTYSAALTAGEWYEYSYDAHRENTVEGFVYGLKLGDEIKTATSGVFQATEGMTIGFGTNGTGTAYFDDLVVTAHAHNFVEGAADDTTIASEATCTEPATYYETCQGCGTKGTDTFPSGSAKGHSPVATPTKEATCTEDGNNAYWTCDPCSKVFSDKACTTETTVEASTIAKHTQSHTDAVEGTCTVDGNVEYWTCSCGKIYGDAASTNEIIDVVDPKHTQTHTVAKENSCTEDGNIEYWTCSCGTIYSDAACTTVVTDVVILKHTQTHTARVEATCTADGNIEYWTCSCGKIYSDVACTTVVTDVVISKHTQTHTARVEATCTEDGNIEYWTCSCGTIYSDAACTTVVTDVVIPKHTQTHTEAVDETCTEYGNIEYWTCSCGIVYADAECTTEVGTDVAIEPHMQATVPAVEATCTTDGNIEHWACACGKLYADVLCTTEITAEDTVIAKHTQAYVKEVAATAAKTGVKAHYKCSCGKLYADAACTKKVTASELVIAKKVVTVAKTKVSKVTAKKKALAIKWKKNAGVTGYEVQVSLNKNFKKIAKKATVKGDKKVSKTIKGLKSGKKYYVRICAYKVVDGVKFTSDWVKFKKAVKAK